MHRAVAYRTGKPTTLQVRVAIVTRLPHISGCGITYSTMVEKSKSTCVVLILAKLSAAERTTPPSASDERTGLDDTAESESDEALGEPSNVPLGLRFSCVYTLPSGICETTLAPCVGSKTAKKSAVSLGRSARRWSAGARRRRRDE